MSPAATSEAECQVEEEDLGERQGVLFAPVLSTARLVDLMELVAARCLEPILDGGKASIGVALEIDHTAATPLGARVRVRADFLEQQGQVYWFEVTARDEGGCIGKGRHARVIVDVDHLLRGAGRRAGAPPPRAPRGSVAGAARRGPGSRPGPR